MVMDMGMVVVSVSVQQEVALPLLLQLPGCLESLPGEAAAQEVDQHVPYGIQVIAPGLLCR
jgi:hypothetical protein